MRLIEQDDLSLAADFYYYYRSLQCDYGNIGPINQGLGKCLLELTLERGFKLPVTSQPVNHPQ